MAAIFARGTLIRRIPLCLSTSTPRSSSMPSLIHSRISSRIRFDRKLMVLSSAMPFHSITASTRLVSKLASEANACVEGRFANYLSPI